MALVCTIDSPPAGILGPDDSIVVTATDAALTNLIVTVTSQGGEPVVAFVMVDGFQNGFSGFVEGITDGVTVTIHAPLLFAPGPLHVDAEAHSSGGGGPTTLFTHTYSETDTETTSGSGVDLKTVGPSDGIDFASWGTGTLRLTVTGEGGSTASSGGMPWSMVAGPASPGPDDLLAYSFADGALLPGYAAITFNDASDGSGNPYVEFAGPGVAGHVTISVAYDFFSFADRTASIRNFTVTIEGSGGGASVVTASRDWNVEFPDNSLVSQALARVIVQYRSSRKLLTEIAAMAFIGQQVVNLLNAIPPLDDLATATGVHLALIGELVGQTNILANGDAATDSEYRVLIGARITENNGRVTGEAFLAALVQFFQAPIQLEDFGGMAISYGVGRTPTADEIALLDEDIVARPMGVRVDRYFFDTADYFGFDEDPDAKGYGDTDTDPDGGGYSTGF